MTLKFCPEIFIQSADPDLCFGSKQIEWIASKAQAEFSTWLASQPVVYSARTPGYDNDDFWYSKLNRTVRKDTHQARLVDIRKIESACEHKRILIKNETTAVGTGLIDLGYFKYICQQCNKEFRPSKWEPCE